jgi:hypothetical protein
MPPTRLNGGTAIWPTGMCPCLRWDGPDSWLFAGSVDDPGWDSGQGEYAMWQSTRTPIVKAAVVSLLLSGAMLAAEGTALAAAPGHTGATVVEGDKNDDKCKKGYKGHGYKSYGYGSNYGYKSYGYGSNYGYYP